MSTTTVSAIETSPIEDFLKELHSEYAKVPDGNVATYIPELAKADPDWFGICLATTGGAVYQVGNSQVPFTIQSISKPFVYGLALEDHGRTTVLERVGVEPTGDAFNSISLDPCSGRPRNPMINAGAIATAGLIEGKTFSLKFKRLREMMSACAGRPLDFDEKVYLSESETGHRNRAIGHMLRNFDKITGDPIPVVDLYFKQCSVSVTARDLGIMAATLANRGVNPVTGKQALRGEYVESVLSVMGSCGMYDYAGEWMYNIGMPAKSGVAGGVIAVLPGKVGIGVFSPRLDSRGNSVRGIAICKELSRYLELHLFNSESAGRSAIRLKTSGAGLTSSRVRSARDAVVLRDHGQHTSIYQLQGNLTFSSAELLVREVMGSSDGVRCLVLDFRRVLTVNESACRFLYRLFRKQQARGVQLVLVNSTHLSLLKRYMKAKYGAGFESAYLTYEDLDLALEWCENHLLEGIAGTTSFFTRSDVRDYELFEGLTPVQLQAVQKLLHRRKFAAGEVIIESGDAAEHLFFLARGTVSVLVEKESGATRRLATFSPGMAFGELAVLDRAPRSARIVADSTVECDLLSVADFDELDEEHAPIKIALLRNLSLNLCQKLRKANRQISALE